ncbi:MAG: GNAT family N-acetyltransferase [Anaerolineae bacterium]|nr:GNAT family N-acetyltransferase [Gemmatimonadaceae bacterium]
MQPPDRIPTERLMLRRWRTDDAALLKAAVDASLAHLQAWMPWAMAEPTPLSGITDRLAGFVADFDAGREWLYGIFTPEENEVLGGLGLHPRAPAEGDECAAADHVEIGYWLRAGVTGRGYATEVTRGATAVAVGLPGIKRIEIRCDPRNVRSAAVPRRLGFRHVRTLPENSVTPDGYPRDTMIWEWIQPSESSAGTRLPD